MGKSSLRAALACVGALSLASAAQAGIITGGGGIPISLNRLPPSRNLVANTTTDKDGNAVFPDLRPGHYEIVIDGSGLAAAMDRPASQAGGKALEAFVESKSVYGEASVVSFQIPYCPDARGDVRAGFDLPQGGTVSVHLLYGDPRILGAAVGAHL